MKVVVDTSVWIDYLNDLDNPQSARLEVILNDEDAEIVVPDIVLLEVLQGIRKDADFEEIRGLLSAQHVVEVLDRDSSLRAVSRITPQFALTS